MARRASRTVPPVAASLQKPLVALQAATDGDALIKAVFALITRAVPCAFANVCLRIVRREHRNIAYRMIDSRGRDFGFDMLEGAFFTEHPGMPVLLANPGIKFINTREILPPDEVLHASRFYREVMQVIGFRHAVGMFFWEDPPQTPEAIFSVYREEGQPDFDDDEVAILERLHPHIDAALRRHRATEDDRAVLDELRRLNHRAERAACVLHWDLSVAEANRAAREACAEWNVGPSSARLKPPPLALPLTLRTACIELKRRWRVSLRHKPAAGAAARLSVQHPTRPALRATVSLRVHRSDPIAKPQFVIDFEPIKPAAPARRTSRKSVLGTLAPRERDLVRLVSEGKSNQEIAIETGKAVGSVKNALHAIFGKVDVSSRSALIARLGGLR